MSKILVDVDAYLNDCPPWDETIDNTIDKSIIPEIAAEIARRFDSTEIYGQIDSLACALLRERNPNWLKLQEPSPDD